MAQRIRRLKIDPSALVYTRTIYFDTIENYCRGTKMTRDELESQLGSDGFTVLRGDSPPLVLYNANAPVCRRAFTLAHEVGHICLGHRDDNPENEAQANLFAANLLMPRILLFELKRRYGHISAGYICRVFTASRQAAELQMRQTADEFSALERELLRAYAGLLSSPGEPELGF
ncbi:MAG: ImmA/IrrE family metallo-endopeptidase [Oscillospiraceae bacterium]|nr:ImmA/IrrE family metallo-endopeptidase [Oscillospiraceae bacterium]